MNSSSDNSLLASFAAILTLSRHQFADPNVGRDLELEVIAAVVVGGTRLMGGRGTVIGSLLGLLIIVVLGAGLAALAHVAGEVAVVRVGDQGEAPGAARVGGSRDVLAGRAG